QGPDGALQLARRPRDVVVAADRGVHRPSRLSSPFSPLIPAGAPRAGAARGHSPLLAPAGGAVVWGREYRGGGAAGAPRVAYRKPNTVCTGGPRTAAGQGAGAVRCSGSLAQAATSQRECRASLSRMRCTWTPAVPGVMASRSASWRSEWQPAASRAATS